MTRRGGLLGAAVLLLASATGAAAQDQGCMYEGTHYEEGATVCQGGLLQTCINGDWQSQSGRHCDEQADQDVEPSDEMEVLPQGGFVQE